MPDGFMTFDSVTRVFPPQVIAVKNLSFGVTRGSWILLKGPSGSGKSTVLHLASGLDRPSSGKIVFDGVVLSELSASERATVRRLRIGIIFQQMFLVPYLSALENVCLAQHLHSVVDESQAKRVIAQVGLAHRLHHLPSELSGGEKQRLCVARAVVNSPEVILADEPTASLDEASQAQVLELFSNLNQEGMTLIMTSHDPVIDHYAREIHTLRFGQIVGKERLEQ